MELLSDLTEKPKSEREKFKQGTVFLVGEILHYLRILNHHDQFMQFAQEIEEHRQNITLLKSEIMTEDLMKDSWKFIDLYVMMITQFAIQEMGLILQNSSVAQTDPGIYKYYEKHCNKVEDIAVGLMREFQRELIMTKRVLQIVLSIHEWKLKGNTGIIAIMLRQSLMSTKPCSTLLKYCLR